MAFRDEEIAEHIQEVFGDLRLGRREGRAEEGYRYFRRSQRQDGKWERSERYTVNLPTQPRLKWSEVSPPAPLPFVCKGCGKAFGYPKGLRSHEHWCKASR